VNFLHVDPDPCESEHQELARLTDENANLRAAVQAVRELHSDDSYGRCVHCPEECDCYETGVAETGDCTHGREPWPCPTIRTLSAVPSGGEAS
jgi:hypothetical protein